MNLRSVANTPTTHLFIAFVVGSAVGILGYRALLDGDESRGSEALTTVALVSDDANLAERSLADPNGTDSEPRPSSTPLLSDVDAEFPILKQLHTDSHIDLLDHALTKKAASEWAYDALIIHHWAMTDPGAALAYIHQLDATDLAEDLRVYLAQNLPQALLAYADLLPDDVRADARLAAIRRLARIDARLAYAMIEQYLPADDADSAHRIVDRMSDHDETAILDDPANALALALRQPPDNQGLTLNKVFRELGKHDPEAAVGLIDTLDRQHQRRATIALLREWVARDPAAASRWVVTIDNAFGARYVSMSASAWSKVNQEAAESFAATLTGRDRSAFLVGVANGMSDKPLESSIRLLEDYSDEPVAGVMMREILPRWVAEKPIEAATYVNSLPSHARIAAINSSRALMRQANDQLMAFVDAVADPAAQNMLLPRLATRMAQQDPVGAVDLIASIQAGPLRDQSLENAARRLASHNPQLAERAALLGSTLESRQRAIIPTILQSSEAEAQRIARQFSISSDELIQIEQLGSLANGNYLFPDRAPSCEEG